MMYAKREHAIRALCTFLREHKIQLRTYLVNGEAVSPAEVWLVGAIIDMANHKLNGKRRKMHRRMIGLARSLNLYPIPDWYEVRQRLLKAKERRP